MKTLKTLSNLKGHQLTTKASTKVKGGNVAAVSHNHGALNC